MHQPQWILTELEAEWWKQVSKEHKECDTVCTESSRIQNLTKFRDSYYLVILYVKAR